MILVLLFLTSGCGGEKSPGTPADDTAVATPDANAGSGSVEPADEWNPDDFEHAYDVGPGHAYDDPGQIPW
jgi:hypothetical protein